MITDAEIQALQERNAQRAKQAREAMGQRLVTHPANAPQKRDGRSLLDRYSFVAN